MALRPKYLVGAVALALAPLAPAAALAAKPGGGGGSSSAARAGDNLAELIAGNLTQLLIVLIGAFALAAFAARSIGQAMMLVVVGLLAGMFIIEPDLALNLFRGIYGWVF